MNCGQVLPKVEKNFLLAHFIISFLLPNSFSGTLIDHRSHPEYLVYDSAFPVKSIVQYYSGLRDIYRSASGGTTNDLLLNYYPNIIFINLLAIYINASLVTPQELNTTDFKYPQVISTITVFWATLRNYQNETLNFTAKIPPGVRVVGTENILWNFAYCHKQKQEHGSHWDFTIFLEPFDKWTWALLLIAFIVVVPLSGKVSRTIMSVVSAALSSGTKGLSNQSKLFILWAGMCMILTNFYLGQLTSKVTVPPKGNLMTHFHQLQQNNYTIIAPEEVRNYLRSTILYFTRSTSKTGKVFRKLLEKVVLVPSNKIYGALELDQGRVFTIASWSAVHSVNWIRAEGATSSGQRLKTDRKCHVGQELLKVSEQFLIFIPPRNSKLVGGLQRLLQAGIYQRWTYEENGLWHSRRVQDRVRVKSPTKILDLEVTLIPAEGLKGKMATMFLLWCACISLSMILLCAEVTLKVGSTFLQKVHI